MLSVIIPTLNAEKTLTRTLASLVPGALDGFIREVIITDGGSTDTTAEIADAAGAEFVRAPRGRGSQLRAGAEAARSQWLLFLHGDTTLDPSWLAETRQFIERMETQYGPGAEQAAYFKFTLNDYSRGARILERGVAWRCALLALPYGDQGLLISKQFYDDLGGHRPWEIMEDVDLVRRIGRQRLIGLRTPAVTSAARYVEDGFAQRSARNLTCLALYFLKVPPRALARFYG